MIINHIDDLKQQHIQELMSCKSQFETDIKEALERTKWRQTVDDDVEEPIQDFLIEQQSYESESGEYLPVILDVIMKKMLFQNRDELYKRSTILGCQF